MSKAEQLDNQDVDDNGDDFIPTGDEETTLITDKDDGAKGDAVLPDAKDDKSGDDDDDQIDADTLAAIAGDDKPKMVPHSRFQEKNDEAKAHRARVLELEEELARAKGTAPAAAPKEAPKVDAYDYDAAEDRYTAAVLDGDATLAKQIRGEIRTRERADARAEAETAADSRYAANKKADDQSRAETERDLAVAKAYAAYPFLDSKSADANPDAIEEVIALAQFYTGNGKTMAEAIATATAKVGPRYVPVADELKPTESAKPDLQKGIDRAAKIPAKAEGIGARGTKIDVSKMSRADLKALSPEDEARLAGDIV